jgi:hypothetical protein
MFIEPEAHISPDLIVSFGLLMGALTFLGSWLPFKSMPNIPIIDGIIALTVIKGILKYGWIRGLFVTASLLLIVFGIGLGSLLVIEKQQVGRYYNPISEIKAIADFDQAQRRKYNPGRYTFPQRSLSIDQRIVWESTGSDWLDVRASRVRFLLDSTDERASITFEIKDGSKTAAFERVNANGYSKTHSVRIGKPYNIILIGDAGKRVEVSVVGLLEPNFDGRGADE